MNDKNWSTVKPLVIFMYMLCLLLLIVVVGLLILFYQVLYYNEIVFIHMDWILFTALSCDVAFDVYHFDCCDRYVCWCVCSSSTDVIVAHMWAKKEK